MARSYFELEQPRSRNVRSSEGGGIVAEVGAQQPFRDFFHAPFRRLYHFSNQYKLY